MRKIALDTNVFRDIDFINFLIVHKTEHEVFLPSIVALELGFFRALKGIEWKEFEEYLNKFNCAITPWKTLNSAHIITNAINNRTRLPFSDHFRDFIIGTQCSEIGVNLITLNKNHFSWVTEIEVWTPEECFLKN